MMKLNYFQIFKDNLIYIGLTVGACVALAVIFSAIQPKEYSSQIQVMIVPGNVSTVDATSASKTSEYVARKLATVIHTVSFLDKVVNSELIDLSQVTNLDESKKREAWKNKVTVNMVPESGILKITAYDENKASAESLVNAMAYVLSYDSSEYYGSAGSVKFQTIDTALTSKYPVRPNIVANLLIGLIVGALGGYGFFLLKAELGDRFKFSTKSEVVKKCEKLIEKVEYKVLGFNDSPDYEPLLNEQIEPVTMQDYIK